MLRFLFSFHCLHAQTTLACRIDLYRAVFYRMGHYQDGSLSNSQPATRSIGFLDDPTFLQFHVLTTIPHRLHCSVVLLIGPTDR